MRAWKKTLKDFMSFGLSAAMVASFCFVAPGTAVADGSDTGSAAVANGQATDTTYTRTDDGTQNVVEASDYTNQYFKDLLAAGQLSAGSNVKLEARDDLDGVLVSGSASELAGQGIAVSKTLNFDEGTVGRIRVRALTARKTKATLVCYVDGGSEPVASFQLKQQKKADNWDTGTKDYCLDISALKLTGEHTVSFKIVDASAETPQVLLKSFEFAEFSVPLVNFNIDESLGSVDAMNASSDHSTECYGSIDIDVPDGYVGEYSDEPLKGGSYELDYVRGRGNSTWSSDVTHKPYKVKLDKKASLLGMGKNKHWVLLANYYDNSQLRNKITYWLSEQMGFEYTVKLEPVEVVMNGEYYGSYYLCEQVRVGKNRVDIDDLEETPDATDADTISGGYLVNMEYGEDAHQNFTTKHENGSYTWTIESPKFDTYFNEAQYNYISNYFSELDTTLYSKNMTNEQGKRYTEYLDLKSAVDYLWLQEYSLNGDAYVSGSTYLYKKRNGKLYYGPVWDFDYVAWGSTEYSDLNTIGWNTFDQMWIERLVCDKEFIDAFKARWQDLKSMLAELTATGGKLDQFAAKISKAVNYNAEKYNMTKLWDDDDDYYDADAEEAAAVKTQMDDATSEGEEIQPLTFKQEVERLRSWVNQRAEWVDGHVNMLDSTECTITYKNGNKTIGKQTGYVGKALYTATGDAVKAPKKKGYSFVGWKTSYHLSYEAYLKLNNWTEQELIAEVGAEQAAKIKKNGYSFNGVIGEGELILPCDVTLTAVFESKAAENFGKIATKGGVKYQVTGASTKAGYTVKAVGLSDTKVKTATIAKKIKFKGRSYTVTEVGAKAFKGCGKLKKLTIKGNGLYVRNATFKVLSKKAVVSVPKSALGYYKSKISCRTVKAL